METKPTSTDRLTQTLQNVEEAQANSEKIDEDWRSANQSAVQKVRAEHEPQSAWAHQILKEAKQEHYTAMNEEVFCEPVLVKNGVFLVDRDFYIGPGNERIDIQPLKLHNQPYKLEIVVETADLPEGPVVKLEHNGTTYWTMLKNVDWETLPEQTESD